MKRRLFTMIAASVMALSSYAQIGSSTSRTIQTYVEQENYEVSYARRYNRLYAGFGLGMASVNGGSFSSSSISGPGCVEAGWTIGFPLLKKADLFLETGLDFNYKFLEGDTGDDTYISVYGPTLEIPINLTYRFKVGNRKFISPYVGMSVGLFPSSEIQVEDSYRNLEDEACPFFAGLQLGVNVDLKHFHIGLGWYKNLSNLLWENYEDSSDPKMKYSDFRVRIGYTFNRKTKKKLQ